MNKTLYCTTEFEVVLKMHLDFTLDAEAQEISKILLTRVSASLCDPRDTRRDQIIGRSFREE